MLYYFLPKPNLVIFLDAPAEVLYQRKRESSLKHLRTRREATLKQGENIDNFVRIDASQPLETVMEEVISQINAYHESLNSNKKWQIFAQHRK
jgi:thymidylate kinase